MLWRVQADNFFYTTTDSIINDLTVTGTFNINQKTVNWYTIEDWDYMFWMVVGLNSPSTAEIFRIINVTWTVLTYDKRISPTWMSTHIVWDLCNMQVASEFFNYISNNIDDFWYTETVSGTGNELKVKIYWGRVEDPSAIDINVVDTTLTLSINNTHYIYFDDNDNTFKSSLTESETYKIIARVVTDANSVNTITDLRAIKAILWMVPLSLTTIERIALTNVRAGTVVYDTTLWENYQYISGWWQPISAWSTQPNASEIIAGKVEKATDAEFSTWAETGWTWAFLFATPQQIKNSTINSAIFTKQASVSTPASGNSSMYVDSADEKAKIKQDNWDIDTVAYLTDINTVVEAGESVLSNSDYLAWEAITKWDSLFVETWLTFAVSTNKQNIWDVVWNTRVSFPFIGSWVASNSLKLSLCKTGTPSTNLIIRLETDNAGSPSGTLIDINATATITAASLTTSLVDTTVTLLWSILNTLWNKYHIVIAQTGDIVNASNYFNIWYSTKDTTTRWFSLFNWTLWVPFFWVSAQDAAWQWWMVSTSYEDINDINQIIPNYKIKLLTMTSWWTMNGWGYINITSTTPNILLQPETNYTFTKTYSGLITKYNNATPSSNNVVMTRWYGYNVENFIITTAQVSSFPYISSTLVENKLLSKTNANLQYKLWDITRIATDNYWIWELVKYDFEWISKQLTWLTIGSNYYISNTPWLLSTTPWINMYLVGVAKSTTTLDIIKNDVTYTWLDTRANISRAWISWTAYSSSKYFTSNWLMSFIWGKGNTIGIQTLYVQLSNDNINWTDTTFVRGFWPSANTSQSITMVVPAKKYVRFKSVWDVADWYINESMSSFRL